MDCSSHTDEPVQQTVRQTCDAFLELGPHAQSSANHHDHAFNLDHVVPVQVPEAVLFASVPTPPPRRADISTHPSILTTVLKI
jgi:hypothetical protein